MVTVDMITHDTNTNNFELLTEQEISTCRVLIVDDEPSIRIILTVILEEAGYSNIEAIDSGEKALDRISEAPPDLILMDVMMPGINGFDVCREIRKDQALQEISIIFITALEKPDSLVEAFEAGANDYLTKPFNANEVKVRVRNHLRLKKAIDKLRRYSCDLEKLVEEESRELIRVERQAAFGQLIQGIIHNLKGPLTAINAGLHTCQFAIKNAPFEETDQKALSFCQSINQSFKMVKTGSERLTGMINSMMTRSHAERSRSFEVTDLNKIIKEELEFLDADLKFKNKFKKDIKLADKPLTINAVPAELAQVVNNLIRNAMDALHDHPDPAISIETNSTGNNVFLTLADNGPGISSENIHHVFDPLFTTKPKISDESGDSNSPTGTGLGLYTCMRIIVSHHGSISVQSDPEVGTVFRVTLPGR